VWSTKSCGEHALGEVRVDMLAGKNARETRAVVAGAKHTHTHTHTHTHIHTHTHTYIHTYTHTHTHTHTHTNTHTHILRTLAKCSLLSRPNPTARFLAKMSANMPITTAAR
jgi:ABC-type Zn2+ transport system substrate-binding protein/surface adhesin